MSSRKCNAFLLSLISLMLNGCAPSPQPAPRDGDSEPNQMAVPRDARIVSEGRGIVGFHAPRDGRVYLYDLDSRELLDSQPIRRGQEYIVDPDENKATLDGRRVVDRDLKRKHAHRLYFLPADSRWSDRDDRDGGQIFRLPRAAEEVEHGHGEISWRARRDGMVYVQDADADRIVCRHDIHRDQQIVVTPDKDRIEIDGRSVYSGNLVRDHQHRIYFDRD